MARDFVSSAKGNFGKLLAEIIRQQDGTIAHASEKIGLHPYVISKHMRMKCQLQYYSLLTYSKYLNRPIGELADMVYKYWEEKGANHTT